jgi:drug/metabolite transporter (DMT)-like permease
MATIDILLLLALSAIWGSSFIFMRYLAPLIGPVATADMRMFIAGVFMVLLFLAIRFKPEWRKNWKHYLLIGVLNSAVPFLLYSIAALYLPASMEAIFNSMSPMFGAIFSAIWLKESLTARKVTGLLLGAGGVAVMSSLGGLDASAGTILSVAACLCAPMCYGLAGIYIKKKAGSVKPVAIAGGSQLAGGLALMPFLLVARPPAGAITVQTALLVIAFALVCSALAYLIYYRLIARVGPTRALTVTFLIPVFAMLWGFLFLGEPITWSMLAGASIILLGTFLVVAPRRRTVVQA